jgi:two-component system sporulation sensor kinase A
VQAERDELLQERKAVLRERMIANRVANLGLIAAGLNHHIGNRLLTVKTFLDLMAARPSENSGGHDFLRDPDLLESARLDIEKILGLLADLRAASAYQIDAPAPDEIKIKPALAGLLANLQPQLTARRIEVANEIPENLPALFMEQPKFNRLIELLLRDELAMLPAGSHIHLTAEETTDHERPEVMIRLADNGPALPQDALRLVLDPFATEGRPSEYGINLMVCFFIVHQHGGSIHAQSLPAGGNHFVVRLPLRPDPLTLSGSDTVFLKRAMANNQLWAKLQTSG